MTTGQFQKRAGWRFTALRSAGLAVAAVTCACVFCATGTATGTAATAAPAGYTQERGWDEPPSEYDEVSRKGFHDGIEGARKDYDNHRSPDPHNREEFRHPHVSDRDRDAYRHGFERGYQVGWDHIMHDHR